MPFTFSHPAAILPLKRLVPKYLSLTLLIVGTMLPDLVYYLPVTLLVHDQTHSIVAAFTYGLPVGFLLYALTRFLREPALEMLPDPHRQILRTATFTAHPFRPLNLVRFTVSLLIGYWSHVFWDGFTHLDGWYSQNSVWWNQRLLGRPLHNWAQHFSSALGLVLLVWLYELWLRKKGSSLRDTRLPSPRWIVYWITLFAATLLWSLVHWGDYDQVSAPLAGTERLLVADVISSITFFGGMILLTLFFLKVKGGRRRYSVKI